MSNRYVPSDPKVLIEAQLRLAEEYFRDSRVLAATKSRNSVIMLFQAAEAALIAAMISEGRHASGRATQHQLGAMNDTLSDKNPLKALFFQIERLTGYATTFRYASSSGRIKPGPSPDELAAWQAVVEQILVESRAKMGDT